jgi:hypothetical protein
MVELHSTPAGRQAGGRRRLQVVDPGSAARVRYGLPSPIARRMVELHSTPPAGRPAEDDDESSIPGECGTSPMPVVVADRSAQLPGNVELHSTPAGRRAGGRRRLQVVDPGGVRHGSDDGLPSPIARRAVPRECRVALDPAGRRPAEDDDCKSSIPGAVRHASDAGCRRRSLRAVPGNVELHSTPPPGEPAEDDDCKSSIPGGAARVRYGLSSPIAPRAPRECRVALDPRRPASRGKTTTASRRSRGSAARVRCPSSPPIAPRAPRECRVALDPAGRQAGERRRLQVVDPGSRPGMSDSATRAGLALACHLK